MFKLPLLLTAVFSLHTAILTAATETFFAKEGEHVLKEEGDCKQRYAPCSTFKIALSLMGFDDGILIDETHPVWNFKKGYPDWLEKWKAPHNPKFWMQNSCVWYSQVLTKKMGMKKFKSYLKKLDYGNMDASGDKGKNNGLTNSWLSSSLQISPEEQVAFLQKIIAQTLPITKKAHETCKKIMFLEDLENGWKLYGKTGSGVFLNADGSKNQDRQFGWFVGWLQKGDRTIVFAHHIANQEKQEAYASLRSKAIAKEKLARLIKEIE